MLILQIPIQHVYTADFSCTKDPKNRQDKKIIAFTNSFKGLHSEDLTSYLTLSEGFIKNCTVEILPATKHSLPSDNYRLELKRYALIQEGEKKNKTKTTVPFVALDGLDNTNSPR